MKNKSNGKAENQNGSGWVKGNKYNASFGGNTIISNGMKTWTIIKEDKTVYESDANNNGESINPKKIMTIWETGFKNKYEKEEALNGETVHVINLFPKNPAKSEFSSITVYISKSSNSLKLITGVNQNLTNALVLNCIKLKVLEITNPHLAIPSRRSKT